MNDFSQTIIAAAQTRRAQSIAFLGRLIKAQRSGESAVQQCFADHLTEAGCQVESLRYAPAEVRMQHEFATGEVAAADERCSLIARLRGEGAGRSLIFFGHPDGEPVMNLFAALAIVASMPLVLPKPSKPNIVVVITDRQHVRSRNL